ANLSHTELAGANLSHANLSHTELAGANLSHANLSHTELAGADITQAIFSDNLGLSVSDRSALMLRGATFQDSSVVKESKVSQLDLVLRESDEGFSGNESSSSDPFSGNDSWESRREASVVNIAPYKATPIKGSAISGMLPYLSRSDQYQLLNELHDLLDEPLVASFKNSPYQVLRLRQASISFYMAVGFSVISVVLSLSLGFFLITGVISQPLLAVSSMVASGAASLYGYKLYEGANKRLEAYWNIMLRRYKLPDSNPGEVLDDASTSDTPG
ncbi:MAG: pentapeptide repeat-containing protein, partial [Cyanobacteria bacterium P01_F01_bin.53]